MAYRVRHHRGTPHKKVEYKPPKQTYGFHGGTSESITHAKSNVNNLHVFTLGPKERALSKKEQLERLRGSVFDMLSRGSKVKKMLTGLTFKPVGRGNPHSILIIKGITQQEMHDLARKGTPAAKEKIRWHVSFKPREHITRRGVKPTLTHSTTTARPTLLRDAQRVSLHKQDLDVIRARANRLIRQGKLTRKEKNAWMQEQSVEVMTKKIIKALEKMERGPQLF